MTSSPRPAEPGFLGKLFALLAGVILLVLGFMFSVVMLAILAVAGLAAWAYFWWKTRALRQAMRDYQRQPPMDGQVIDGEVIVVHETEVIGIEGRTGGKDDPG